MVPTAVPPTLALKTELKGAKSVEGLAVKPTERVGNGLTFTVTALLHGSPKPVQESV